MTSAAQRAEKAFYACRVRFENDKADVEAGWKFARACFDRAEYAESAERRELIARQGIEAARHALTHDAKSAETHYYLALVLGQLARTKRLGALKIVHEMERELKLAVELNERLDFAGPHRSLAMLYREAPPWPISVGNKSKARAHFERTIELFPTFPDNRLAFAEACVEWKEKRILRFELEALEKTLPAARKNLTGPEWEASWADWNVRWEKLKPRLEEFAPAQPPR